MPYNGSGSFTLVTGNPVVTGTVINSTVHNNTQNDIAAGLTNAITRDGQSVPFGNLPMGGFKHTGVADATVAGQYLTYNQGIRETQLADTTSAAEGSGLVGFDGALNYAAKTIGWAANGQEVDPRWFKSTFGLAGDDTAALQAAINWIPSAGAGTVRLPRNCNAQISAQISITNRRLIFEGDNSTVTLTANANYLFYIDGENVKIQNVTLAKGAAVVAIAAIFCTGLQHRFENITSRNQKWATFFYGQDMKESHLTQIRVDLDVATKLGDVVKLDYCVNNTWSDSFIGYAAQGLYCTGATKPPYATEGLSLSNVIMVYCGKAITADRVTALTVGSGCIFDFCETWGVFCTNGSDLTICPGVWIASNLTNGFIGVGTGATFADAKVIGATITRGAAAITGSIGVSLSGPRARVAGCSFEGGMNGGVVTDASCTVFGNSVASPGTQISMPNGNSGPGITASWASTFTLTFGGAAVGLVINVLAATYTEIGNEITARVRVTLSAKGTSVGTVLIGGLPKSCNGTYRGSVLVVRQANMTAALAQVGQVVIGTDTAQLFLNSAITTQATDTAFSNTSELDLEIRYRYA